MVKPRWQLWLSNPFSYILRKGSGCFDDQCVNGVQKSTWFLPKICGFKYACSSLFLISATLDFGSVGSNKRMMKNKDLRIGQRIIQIFILLQNYPSFEDLCCFFCIFCRFHLWNVFEMNKENKPKPQQFYIGSLGTYLYKKFQLQRGWKQ